MIHMQAGLPELRILLSGNSDLGKMPGLKMLSPFDDLVVRFLADFSEMLRKDKHAAAYPDVATFAFFCRRANLHGLADAYSDVKEKSLGRGVSFHIAPSNVPINFAFSLVAGLLSGNACIVRVSDKEFPQVDIVCNAMRTVLARDEYQELKDYIAVVRYAHSLKLNTYLSSLCDIRIIWGGDSTIAEIRKAPLPARAFDMTFSDRYSALVVDAAEYLSIEDKERVANGFYNDTYLFDQNACSSPRLIYWVGNDENVGRARDVFWSETHRVVLKKGYQNEPVSVVEKYTTFCRTAIGLSQVNLEPSPDNLILRVKVAELDATLPEYACPGGLFFEYISDGLEDLLEITTRKYQTLTYVGFNPNDLRRQIVEKGACGIDRIVPVGDAGNFNLTWDGYDIIRQMSRLVWAT